MCNDDETFFIFCCMIYIVITNIILTVILFCYYYYFCYYNFFFITCKWHYFVVVASDSAAAALPHNNAPNFKHNISVRSKWSRLHKVAWYPWYQLESWCFFFQGPFKPLNFLLKVQTFVRDPAKSLAMGFMNF